MKNEEEGSSGKGREDPDDENNKTGGAVVVKARVAPSGAFGLPASFDLVCRSIVFLDDALCAFPVGHGVLLVERKRRSTKKGGGSIFFFCFCFRTDHVYWRKCFFTRDCREWRRGNRTVDCVVRDTSTDAKARMVENVFVERHDRDRREEKFELFFQCNSSFDEWMFR